jgi:hypothetical protein
MFQRTYVEMGLFVLLKLSTLEMAPKLHMVISMVPFSLHYFTTYMGLWLFFRFPEKDGTGALYIT